MPSHAPSAVITSSPSGPVTSASASDGAEPRGALRSAGTPASAASSFALFAASSWPARRRSARCTRRARRRARRPRGRCRRRARAGRSRARPRAPSSRALPANVSASSTTSGSRRDGSSSEQHVDAGQQLRAARRACRGCASRTRADARHRATACALRGGELRGCPCAREIEHRVELLAIERARARRCPGPRSACRSRSPTTFMSTSALRVLDVRQVEHDLAADDADRDRGDRRPQRAHVGELAGRDELLDRERERDPRAGDRRDARAAVGLQHVAVDVIVRSPSAARSTAARSERPISRWISLPRPPGSRLLRVCVERGSIAYSAVSQPWPLPLRNAGTPLLDARGAQHPGVAELDQRRAFGVLLEAGG